jgi:hypothetical protein
MPQSRHGKGEKGKGDHAFLIHSLTHQWPKPAAFLAVLGDERKWGRKSGLAKGK